jgi:hypothetical protein
MAAEHLEKQKALANHVANTTGLHAMLIVKFEFDIKDKERPPQAKVLLDYYLTDCMPVGSTCCSRRVLGSRIEEQGGMARGCRPP